MESGEYSLAVLVALAKLLSAGSEQSISEMRALVHAHYQFDLRKSMRGEKGVWNGIIGAAIRNKVLVKTKKTKKQLRANEIKRTQDVFVYSRTENELVLPPNSMKEALATLAKHQIDKAQAA